MFSPQVLDHFHHPRNLGVLDTPDASAECSNPVCGDQLKLTLHIRDGHIAAIRFQCLGCVPAVACASALTELALGQPIAAARALPAADLLAALGGLPPASAHAAALAVEALQAALQ